MLKVLPSDELLSYQLLFIKDVKTAKIHSRDPIIYETQHKRLFQKVRLCGIIVSKQDTDSITEVGNSTRCIIYLDDSTETIQVHISSRLFKREDSEKIKKATTITIIGEPKLENNTMIVICNGYQIEQCLTAEIEHWLKVMKNNKDKKWIQHRQQQQSKKINPLIIEENNDNNNDQKRQKIKLETENEGDHPKNIFNSLSSQPSPIRGPIQEFLFSSSPRVSRSATSPLQQRQHHHHNNNDLGGDNDDLNNVDSSSYWHWSPDHIAATSTPIKNVLRTSSVNNSPSIYRSSPLNNIITNNTNNNNNNNNYIDDDDEFGFDDDDNSAFGRLDFGDLEKKAFELIKKE